MYFYPERDDARLHHPGVRLQRLAVCRCRRRGYDVLGISPNPPEKLAEFRERDGLTITILSDAGQVGDAGLRRLRPEEAVRQAGRGRHPLDVRRRRGREASPWRSTTSRPPATFPSFRGTSASPPDLLGSVRTRRSGGTGRHAGFRSLCLRVCGFESRLRHPSATLRGTVPRTTLYRMGAEAAVTQLRRGAVEHCVLALLEDEERYGYDLVQELTAAGLVASEGTVYPLLSRLRKDELVATVWRDSPSGPPRRYYALTQPGPARSRRLPVRVDGLRCRRRLDPAPPSEGGAMTTTARHPLRRGLPESACGPRPRSLPVDQARELVADIEEHLVAALPHGKRPRPRYATSWSGSVRRRSSVKAAGPAAAGLREPVVRLARWGDHLPGRGRDPLSVAARVRAAVARRPGDDGPRAGLDRAAEVAGFRGARQWAPGRVRVPGGVHLRRPHMQPGHRERRRRPRLLRRLRLGGAGALGW